MLQHRAFWTGRFDVGNLVQAVWSTANGDFLSVTGLTGKQISRLGAHFDPIVAAFAPLWWLWPDPALLLVTQGLAVATGAVPVYLLGRRHLDSEWVAAGLALAYLLHPATQWLVLDDFHPVALATPLLLWGFWFLDSGRLLPFALVAGVACLTKEQIGLVVAAMGLWYALRPEGRRAGLAIAVAGALVSIVAVTVVVPHFAPGGGSPFEGRYESVGGSPGGIAKTAVTDPGAIISEITHGHDLAYLGDLLLPLLGLPLLAPLAALTAAPELLLNLLSGTRTQTSIHFHYTAGALPGLFVAAILGAARLRRRFAWARWPEGRAVVLSTVLAGVLLGPLPLWRNVPLGSGLGTHEHVVGHHAAVARRALAARPARRRRERDEHPRGPPVRAPARLQLPGARRVDVGGGRPATSQLPRHNGRAGPLRARTCCPPRPGRVRSRLRRGRHPRAPQERHNGIVCGSRYAVSASAPRRATRSSSSGAASGTAHARYQTTR